MAYDRHGIVVRIVYLAIACVWYVLSGFGRLFAGRRLVLCYHGVKAGHAARFREQMRHLHHSQVRDGDRDGHYVRRRSLPSVCVTFDDAFENLLTNAAPVLDEYGIPAVVFAVPGNFGRTPQWAISRDHPEYGEKVMTAEQLRQLADGKITIGSHTQTHPALPTLSCDEARRELTESRKNLEGLLGRPVDEMALPYGQGGDAVVQIAREAGYRKIYTLEPRMHAPESEPDVVGRFSMSPDVWPVEFRLTCAGAYAWLHPWRRCVRAVRRRIARKR